MRILVIGGAGYIGSHVARAFLDRGAEVTVFDNLSTGVRENLFPEARFEEGDIVDYGRLAAVMKGGYDALVHLAAFKAAGESMEKPEKYSVNNISGTLNILNAACAAGVRRIVFSSSAAVYGEPEYVPLDEGHPTNPENYYGFTKLEIERLKALILQTDKRMKDLERSGFALDEVRQDKTKLLKLIEKRSLRVFDFRERFEEHHESAVVVRGVVHPGVVLESHNRFLEIQSRKERVAFTFDVQLGRIVEKPLK